MSEEKIEVKLECFANNDIKIHFGSRVLPDLLIAKSKVAQEKLGGEARALLAASVAECMVSWLTFLLNKSRIKFNSVKALTEVITGLNEREQNVVKEINLTVDVEVEDCNQRFEHIKNILTKQGCLLSRSLEKGIKVNFFIRKVKEGNVQ
ncbi:MAG: OsmC family protein [Nitrososphaeria archaeon]